MTRPPSHDGRLPRLLTGARRVHFANLVATGVAQAALIVVTAVLMPILLGSTVAAAQVFAAGGLGVGALALGVARWRERVHAERLGQDYVQEIRTGLVTASLRDAGPHLGITIARTTNDLSSVRNWIALGVTPLVVGTPIIIGAVAALAVLDARLALAVAVPVVVLLVVFASLARPQYRRSRELRRLRGGLAAQVGDTVQASASIRVAGGERREVRRIRDRGQKVADAAVARAEVAGVIRGATITTAAVASVAVAAVGAGAGLAGATIATALTIVGVVAGPLSDLGRVVEYRQSYRAARRILGPALDAATAVTRTQQADRDHDALPGLTVRGLAVEGHRVRDLHAHPGDVVVLRSSHPGRTQAVVNALCGLAEADSGDVVLSGARLLDLSGEERRDLLGHAARDLPLERGSVKRLVRYRRPSSNRPVEETLARVGLTDRVAALPRGIDTVLRRGGSLLTAPERAQVKVARAVYDDPDLVVFDHIDTQLGAAGRAHLRTALHGFPGIVLVDSDEPDAFLTHYREWYLDGIPSTGDGSIGEPSEFRENLPHDDEQRLPQHQVRLITRQ